jgi:hypothetical protein
MYKSAKDVATDPHLVPLKNIFVFVLFSDSLLQTRPKRHPFPGNVRKSLLLDLFMKTYKEYFDLGSNSSAYVTERSF